MKAQLAMPLSPLAEMQPAGFRRALPASPAPRTLELQHILLLPRCITLSSPSQLPPQRYLHMFSLVQRDLPAGEDHCWL